MTVDRGSAADKALQNITTIVAAAADRARTTAQSSSIEMQLSPAMVAAMNRALHVTRRLGEELLSLYAFAQGTKRGCAATNRKVPGL
jgi:hypothetical protein